MVDDRITVGKLCVSIRLGVETRNKSGQDARAENTTDKRSYGCGDGGGGDDTPDTVTTLELISGSHSVGLELLIVESKDLAHSVSVCFKGRALVLHDVKDVS